MNRRKTAIRRSPISDFLKDAVRTETWRGLRVGVFHSTSPAWAAPGINFHGLQAAFPDLPQVHALPGADADAPRTWWTLADVVNCPDLELTLPTRTSIVRTPFTAELVSEATRIIYRAIAAAGATPRLGYETRTRAAAAGIALPADPRHLTPWRPKNARDAKPVEHPRHPDLQHAVLVDDDALDAAESQTLAWAAKESGTLRRYWETEHGLRGYRWYDELPRLIGINVHVRSGTRTHTSTRKTRRDGDIPSAGPSTSPQPHRASNLTVSRHQHPANRTSSPPRSVFSGLPCLAPPSQPPALPQPVPAIETLGSPPHSPPDSAATPS